MFVACLGRIDRSIEWPVGQYSPCDTASLQLWCLTEDHYTRCHFFPAGDVG
jgi:hypothetical protein